MNLYKLSDKIYYSEYEQERDRPALGYIKGDRFSIAVDAGHSDEHVKEFYDLLNKEGLELPSLTIITHWHWDHSFAMHAISGLSIANRRTDRYLKDFISKQNEEYEKQFLSWDPSIAMEYKDEKPIIVKQADIVYDGSLKIDAGNTPIIVFEAISPHTDDASLVYLPKEKVLFFGDAISGVFPTWEADPSLTRGLVETLETLDMDYCIGGHWPIYTKEELLKQLKESI